MISSQQHPVIEQLIQSHVDFITQQILNTEILKEEVQEVTEYFLSKNLADVLSFDHLYTAIEHLLLNQNLNAHLQADLAEHLKLFLLHPLNQSTQLQDIISSDHIQQLATYISSKTEHRQKLIHDLVHHPAFGQIFTDLIQHVLNDYFENSLSNQRPSVSRFMKMGKSVFENMTDLNFTKTLTAYLEKNIIKIGDLSEKILNQKFDNDTFLNIQTNIWEHAKELPLSILSQYIEVNDLEHTVHLAEQFPQHLSQTNYFKQQLHDHIVLWYAKYQHQSLNNMLTAVQSNPKNIEHYLFSVISLVLKNMIQDPFIQNKIKNKLSEFYYQEHTLEMLKRIT